MTLESKVPKWGHCFNITRSCTIMFGLTIFASWVLYMIIYTKISRAVFALSVNPVLNQTFVLPQVWMRGIIKQRVKLENRSNVETGSVLTTKHCSEEFKNRHLMSISYGGRTGNLLFQFATLIATAQLTCYTAIRKPDPIHSIDSIFDLKNVKAMKYIKASFKELREPGYAIYDENITSRILPEYNWTIGGYRQSFRYFSAFSGLIRSSFCFKDDIKKRVAMFLNEGPLNGMVKVCPHVRRTDIVGEARTTKVHVLSNVSYFKRAIAYMTTHLSQSNIAFLVVSDDIGWCRSNIKGDNIHYSPFRSAGDDLYLLTQCDHHILSMGTFSWMGAWLNESGIVIYDKLVGHFEDSTPSKEHRQRDYYPSHWVGM